MSELRNHPERRRLIGDSFSRCRAVALFSFALTALVLTGCGGSSTPVSAGDPGDGTENAEPVVRDQYPFGLACGWEIASNIDTMNIFYPDENAKYWVAMVPIIPNTRLRIDGRYPDTRYFSFNVYDPLLRPTDALADNELVPRASGINPFVVVGAASGDSYQAYLEFSTVPDQRAPNTLYAGDFSFGDLTLPHPLLLPLIYRTYVPAEGQDFDGGVGLPILTLETADGEIELLPTADCVEPLLPTLGGAIADLGINDMLLGINIYDEPLLLANTVVPLSNADAQTHVFRGIPEFYVNFIAELLNLPYLGDAVENAAIGGGGGGFLSNLHNAYTYNIYFRHKGNVILFRAKAPTYRGQPGVPFGSEQLRYWSICQNDVPTQRYTACTRDEQTVLDEDGYFTVVISDAADRPANAIPENGMTWLPWGPYIDAGVAYRHMLPDPGFTETIANIPRGVAVEDIMGDYAPQPAYCTKAVFESVAEPTAKAIFAACRAYSDAL
jgi:hypothetical protein